MNGTTRRLSDHVGAAQTKTVDVYNAKNVTEVKAALADLQQREAAVTSQLDALISAQKELQRELDRLDLFRANLSSAAAKTRAISNGMLSDASSTANRISSSVKQLDLEQERVKQVLTAVEQVRELKSCVLGVAGSMEAQDWETAAGHLSRASKLPAEVIDGEFAARVVPTAEVPDAPRVTLENASESLCGLFLREFDKAVNENDGAKITRFFKLFPLINRSDIGLDVYGRYVCQGVSARARTNLDSVTSSGHAKDGFAYANTLTKLFEHIAQIVDGHGPLVEAHYGAGKMARVVERLQSEADRQGGIIIDTWTDERLVNRQLTDIKAYPYTFLVQSFQPIQQRGGFQGTPRSGSPAPGRFSEDEGVNMKEIDALLNEMTLMLSKWSLYTRFITNKCAPATEDEQVEIPAFLLNSALMKKVEDRLLTPFCAMTTFFIRRSVEKAFQLDEQPPDLSLSLKKPLNSNPPHISSAIEDIMYIVNKVLQQSLATSQTAVISSVIPTLSRVLSSDFLGLEQRKMRDEHYPRPVVQGGLPPESAIVAFIILVNNVDVAKDYISQMITSRTHNTNALADLYPSPADTFHVNTTLTTINTTFTEKCTSLLTDATNVLYNNVAKPRLRPILADTFRDIEYNLSPSELSQLILDLGHDENDHQALSHEIRNRFAHGWDALALPLRRLMTENTFNALLSVTATYLSKMLEKRLWTYAGRINSSGAQRLEHDINEIVKVVVTRQRDAWVLREQFLRCVQICTVLSMDEEEWEEVGSGGAEEVADKLKAEERVRVRKMLID